MDIVQWNPVVGCSPASPGCANCVVAAGAPAELLDASGQHFNGLTRAVPTALKEPWDLKAASAIFVCARGDLFHAATPDAWISAVFWSMEQQPRHLFQIVTKRAARMRAFVAQRYGAAGVPPHIALGVSAERQIELDERLPDLVATRAARTLLSLYPVLGPIALAGRLAGVGAVTFGDEPQRPARPAWLDAIERACRAAGVPSVRAMTADLLV